LLTTTELYLQEISIACGFGSVSHFSKSFKARYGTAPTKLTQGL
jgi:transcriptional regulator GlxA family with amidase domain